jgi:AraC-like DNA-binding protein
MKPADMEGVEHRKVLPCLSVVQATEGSYDIALNEQSAQNTGQGGVFIAPAGVAQRIVHHNGADGRMRAHWIYMDVLINSYDRLDSLFRFPLILPSNVNAEVGERIEAIIQSDDLCSRYAAAYQLIGLLLRYAVAEEEPEENRVLLQRYVAEHFCEKIEAAKLAEVIHCSIPQVYRFTQKYFALSPANYVNSIRLQNAARLLESSRLQIKDIAISSGFDDVAYFSKLFKKSFGASPSQYRERLHR